MTNNSNSEIPWWKKTTVYQLYPRSFYDSNGAGIGDLKSIISKLDYLQDLGVEAIWFSPFFNSPQKDFGYDVSNFVDIDPQYGNMELSDKLIDEIHKRDMKVVINIHGLLNQDQVAITQKETGISGEMEKENALQIIGAQ